MSHVETGKDIPKVGMLLEEHLTDWTALDLDPQDEFDLTKIREPKLPVEGGLRRVHLSLGQGLKGRTSTQSVMECQPNKL